MSFFSADTLTVQDTAFIKKLPPKLKALAFQDEFEVTYTKAERQFITDDELMTLAPGSVMTFDSESYINYAVICFKHLDSGKYLAFEHPFNVGKLRWVTQHFLLVGFNSKNYDLPMLTLALEGIDTKFLKLASNKLIFQGVMAYQFEKVFKVKPLFTNNIDLIEVLPLDGSLKLYSGRLHCKRMQDLPIPEDARLTDEQKQEIKDYCLNDVDNTETIFKFVLPQLELRYSLSNVYNVDLRSKSDAQIAEAVIAAELHRLTGVKPGKSMNLSKYFFYQVPAWLQFTTPELQNLVQLIKDTPFEVEDSGTVKMPDAISGLSIALGSCVYRIGIGGLHSSETTIAHKATEDVLILDRDVASYYPSIILNQELYPRHLGRAFLDVYRSIVQRRLQAKKSGDKVTADSLKITINGSFGKLGNRYSILYSPELLIQVTVSGQLCLLLLIEMIEKCGCGVCVISANTDGVMIQVPTAMRGTFETVIKEWERITGFVTEETEYKAVYSRDVNNYIAIKTDGKTKEKGAYSERGSSGDTPLSRNPEMFVCVDAVKAFLTKNVPVEDTIRACKDIRRFVIVRNVRGGAAKSGKYLGKTIRWYFSTEMKGEINYITSGNKVPNSDGGMPIMEMPADPSCLPVDLDYPKYIAIAQEMLVEIGAIPATNKLQGSLFEHQLE